MTVTLRPAAEADLKEAAQWYEQQRAGLGDTFLVEVERVLDQLRENPLRYPRVHSEVRRAALKRFPFGVFCLVEDRCVVVFAVLHASRNPNQWKNRF